MDFAYQDDQLAIADLAARILGDKVTHASLRDLESGVGDDGQPVERFAADAWSALATADLLGIALPESCGGGGYGITGASLVLTEIGRTAAPLPYLACVVAGAMTVAEAGSPAQRDDLLGGVIAGTRFLTAALDEPGVATAPDPLATTATPLDGGGYRLDGTKSFVPWLSRTRPGGSADQRGRVLVPARTPDGAVIVALVDPGATGVTVIDLSLTDGWPESDLVLDGVVVATDDVLPGDGRATTAAMIDRVTAGLCAIQAGVSDAAVRLTATYTTERHQFGSPIATFQAVAQRAADAYIDAQGIQFTAWQAAWRLDQGLDAADELDIAKFWAAEAGSRVAEAAQHLHGGIGVDTDYPLHRYYRLAKHLELTLGGSTERLRRLGARMAAS
jgi:3-oxocholest-4-en-26-oyl-CoA dehydrogenase beta subunit